MMTSGNVPSSVNLALVTPCHKRGRKDDPNNFRPIAVTHPLMRLYAGLLNTRLLEYIEEHGSEPQARLASGLATLWSIRYFLCGIW